MSRIAKLTPRFLSRLRALGITTGSARSRAVGQVVGALANAPILPGPGDIRSLIPPVTSAWVRRVPGDNLWLWYEPTDVSVVLVAVTTSPPIPAE